MANGDIVIEPEEINGRVYRDGECLTPDTLYTCGNCGGALTDEGECVGCYED